LTIVHPLSTPLPAAYPFAYFTMYPQYEGPNLDAHNETSTRASGNIADQTWASPLDSMQLPIVDNFPFCLDCGGCNCIGPEVFATGSVPDIEKK
jgi:hypothetical protein